MLYRDHHKQQQQHRHCNHRELQEEEAAADNHDYDEWQHHHLYPTQHPLYQNKYSLYQHQYHHQQHQPTKRKNRLALTASVTVILWGFVAWCSVWSLAKQLFDPRHLLAESDETSASDRIPFDPSTTVLRKKTPESAVMDPFSSASTNQIIDLDHSTATASGRSPIWNRVVFLQYDGEEEEASTWTKIGRMVRMPSKQPHPTYPRIIPPFGERGSNEDDEVESALMQDFTRWYPQIDSSDERFTIERKAWPEHEIDPVNCHPMHDWQSTSFPVCNTIHEMDLGNSIVADQLNIISRKGFWRHAWRNDIAAVPRQHNRNQSETTVWKTFKIHHSMEDDFFENNRVDALAMERLTGSPNVIDIYGFCAMTVVQEFAGHQVSEEELNATERLDFAIQVARGIRDIHSVDDSNLPSLVHNDINLANIIVTDDGRPVINDFNIAVLLMKNNSTGEACPFSAHFPNPQWRSPEEQVDSEEESKLNPPTVTEKIDIYAMGNVLFRLVAGGSPWKKQGKANLSAEEKDEVAYLKRYFGTLPEMPAEVNLTEPSTRILYEAMRMCFRFKAAERPSAKELVDFLESARRDLMA